MLSFALAISAGLCAATASLCAKLAFSSNERINAGVCKCLLFKFVREKASYCEEVVFLLRILLFGLMFLFNGLMWTLFVKSMRNSSSSAQAMITNSASNFICSALLGKFVFGEILSLQWWMGASLIILGLFLINKNTKTTDAAFANNEETERSFPTKKHS